MQGSMLAVIMHTGTLLEKSNIICKISPSFLVAIPFRGKVRKASITDKVEKSRMSQAYIDTIKVTLV